MRIRVNPLAQLMLGESLVASGDIPGSLPAFEEAARLLLFLDRFPDAMKVVLRRLFLGSNDYATVAGKLLATTTDPRAFIAKVRAELPMHPSLANLIAALESQRLH